MILQKNSNFKKLYFISVFVNISMTTFSFILPIILYDYTKSAIAMSTMRLVDFLPNVFLGMFIGVLVDRLNRRTTLLVGNIIRTMVAIVFTLVITSTDFSLWSIYLLGFVISSIGYMLGSAQNALIPQLFEKKYLTEIQTKFSLVNTIISIAGPSLLGMLLLWVSNEWFLWLFVACNALIIFWVIQIEKVPSPEKQNQTIWQDLNEGFQALLQNKQLLVQTWSIFFINLSTSLVIGVLTFYALDVLQFSKRELGFMFTVSAFGGILGAKLLGPIRKKYTRGQIYTVSMLIEAILIACYFFAHNWWMFGILLGLRTAITTMTNIVFLAMRQELTPNHLLGRVAGTTSMIMKLALPFGLLIGGFWADHFYIPAIFFVSATIVFSNFFLLRAHKFHLVQ